MTMTCYASGVTTLDLDHLPRRKTFDPLKLTCFCLWKSECQQQWFFTLG